VAGRHALTEAQFRLAKVLGVDVVALFGGGALVVAADTGALTASERHATRFGGVSPPNVSATSQRLPQRQRHNPVAELVQHPNVPTEALLSTSHCHG
jgi:hypothetical protein